MKDCLNDETLQTWLDGELSTDAAAEVESHMVTCETCAENVRSAGNALSLVDSGWNAELPAAIPASLRTRVGEAAVSRSWLPAARAWGIAAAMALLALGVTASLSRRATVTPAPPDDAPSQPVRIQRRTLAAETETARHLEQTQILLRSFRNTEPESFVDLAYDIERSRELLSRNRLLRRRAALKEDAKAERMLVHVEPILLDIANLSDPPISDDIHSLKKRIHDQSFIAELQLYASRVGACSKATRTPCL
jgi:hypothetical protein